MTEMPHEAIETQPPIKDTSPTVSVDIALGQRFRDVVFDYDVFEEEAGRRGVSPDDQATLSIALMPYRFYRHMGAHYPLRSHVEVSVKKEEQANKTLRHELQHAGDYKSDNPENYGSNIRYNLARLVRKPMLILAGYEAVKNNIDAVQTYAQTPDISSYDSRMIDHLTAPTPTRIALLSSLAVFLWSYQFHPRERRARKAAREEGRSVIQLQKSR